MGGTGGRVGVGVSTEEFQTSFVCFTHYVAYTHFGQYCSTASFVRLGSAAIHGDREGGEREEGERGGGRKEEGRRKRVKDMVTEGMLKRFIVLV